MSMLHSKHIQAMCIAEVGHCKGLDLNEVGLGLTAVAFSGALTDSAGKRNWDLGWAVALPCCQQRIVPVHLETKKAA